MSTEINVAVTGESLQQLIKDTATANRQKKEDTNYAAQALKDPEIVAAYAKSKGLSIADAQERLRKLAADEDPDSVAPDDRSGASSLLKPDELSAQKRSGLGFSGFYHELFTQDDKRYVRIYTLDKSAYVEEPLTPAQYETKPNEVISTIIPNDYDNEKPNATITTKYFRNSNSLQDINVFHFPLSSSSCIAVVHATSNLKQAISISTVKKEYEFEPYSYTYPVASGIVISGPYYNEYYNDSLNFNGYVTTSTLFTHEFKYTEETKPNLTIVKCFFITRTKVKKIATPLILQNKLETFTYTMSAWQNNSTPAQFVKLYTAANEDPFDVNATVPVDQIVTGYSYKTVPVISFSQTAGTYRFFSGVQTEAPTVAGYSYALAVVPGFNEVPPPEDPEYFALQNYIQYWIKIEQAPPDQTSDVSRFTPAFYNTQFSPEYATDEKESFYSPTKRGFNHLGFAVNLSASPFINTELGSPGSYYVLNNPYVNPVNPETSQLYTAQEVVNTYFTSAKVPKKAITPTENLLPAPDNLYRWGYYPVYEYYYNTETTYPSAVSIRPPYNTASVGQGYRLACNWENTAYCRKELTALGFTEADLQP